MAELTCHPGGVVGSGPLPSTSGVVIVGIAPGRDEMMVSKTPFTGPAGRLLKACAKTAGLLLKEDTFVTNCYCQWNDAPTPSELLGCAPRLMAELKAAQPKLIIGLGHIVNDYLFGGNKRGALVWSDKYQAWTLYTVHPSAILRPKGEPFLFDFMRDLMKAKMVVETFVNGEAQYDVLWRTATSGADAQEFLDGLPINEPVAIDVETRYKTGSELLCLSIASSNGCLVVPGDLLGGLAWPSKVRWTLHGGMFDKQKLLTLLGIRLDIVEDTLLMSYSLDERGGGDKEGDDSRSVGVHGLKLLAQEYIGSPNYDLPSVEREWDKGPEGQRRVMDYNAHDAEYTRRLATLFIARQEADDVRDVYQRLMIPVANAMADVRLHGVYIDRDAIAQLGREWIPQWMDLEEELKDESGIENLNSHPQLNKYVYGKLGIAPTIYGMSTSADAIDEIVKREENEWLVKLKKWRQIDHLISTYLMGVEDDIESDGRIHPDPILHGTRTGRLAYKNPPVQTIPKHGEELVKIRKMFAVAPKSGLEIIEADYRQAELWTAWFHSQDPELLKSLETGDFHAATTTRVFGIEPDDPLFDLRRHDSKRVTFGIFYGRGVQSLQESFGHTIGYWQDAIRTWAHLYEGFWAWRELEKKKAIREGEQQARTGRKRRYWIVMNHKALNQAINMPIQAVSHDHLLDSFVKLHLGYLNQRLADYGAHILFEVHDSLIIESPIANRQEVLKLIRSHMCEPKFGLPRGLEVDIKVGPNWHDVEKVK